MTVVMPLSRTQLEHCCRLSTVIHGASRRPTGILRLPSFQTQPLCWELLFSLWTWWVFVCLFEPRKEELWTWTFVTYPVNWNVPIKASLFPSEGVTALSLVDRMSRSWNLWLSLIKQQGAHQCAHCLQSTRRILLLPADGWVGEDGLWTQHDECGSLIMSHFNFVVGTKASCSRF